MNQKTVAIIGCGAAAATFIRAFVQACHDKNQHDLTLLIFEPTKKLGTGLAYQDDLHHLLINRPAQTMSANLHQRDEFFRWLQKNQSSYIDQQQAIYPSRKIFGDYLHEMTHISIADAHHYGIQVKIVNEIVTHIRKNAVISIKTLNNTVFMADYVLIATGHNQPQDIYGLKDTPHYLHSPYPLQQHLIEIPPTANIGIMGNSLTAIDIAISLHHLGHCAPITFLSRTHTAPRVKSNILSSYTLQTFTAAVISNKQRKRELTLRDLLRLFRRELKPYQLQWKTFFQEDAKHISHQALIASEIETTTMPKHHQAILAATNDIVEDAWHSLSAAAKKCFITYYQRIWLNNRTPIPPKNAYLLIQLMQQKKLFSVSGLQNIFYNQTTRQYSSQTTFCEKKFDWIINATGPARHVQPSDTFMHNLIENGIATAHPFGGIQVDFDTAAVIDSNGCPDFRLRALGHNTSGVYNYTSSLEMIAKKAQKIAHDIVYRIAEENTI